MSRASMLRTGWLLCATLLSACSLDWSRDEKQPADGEPAGDAGTLCGEVRCDPLAECGGSGALVRCLCPAGTEDRAGDGSECADVDECMLTPRRCHPSALCINESPGFRCECSDGLELRDDACVPVQTACDKDNGGCAAEATCEPSGNPEEPVMCSCPAGTSGNGKVCAPDVLKLAASYEHSCAILSDRSLWCWGLDKAGSLGLGMEHVGSAQAVPARVGSANDWQDVVVGFQHTCGIRGGQVYCWGARAQVGLGEPTLGYEPEPALIDPRADWTQLTSSYYQTCGLRAGRMYCWGDSYPGGYPRQQALDSWQSISMGRCGVRNGEVWCAEARVGTEADWMSVSSNASSRCAIRKGELWCWGYNGSGELGFGPGAPRDVAVPTRVGEANDWQRVAMGLNHACGLRAGRLYCWGSNERLQLGLGVTAASITHHPPTQIGSDASYTELALGSGYTCAVRGGLAYCWGQNRSDAFGVPNVSGNVVTAPAAVDSPPDLTQVDVGGDAACALSAGSLFCWGAGFFGQLGLGDELPRYVPTVVGSSKDWQTISIAAADGYRRYACGIRSGTPYCWGLAGAFLGLGSTENAQNKLVPTQVGTEMDWTDLKTGGATCGIRSGGTLWCWGDNQYGQVGLSAETVGVAQHSPVQISTDTTYTQVTVGRAHACAITSQKYARCWGNNDFGQVGDGNIGEARPTAVMVGGTLGQITQITAGDDHTCAIGANGSIDCWGRNQYGQLGIAAAYETNVATPRRAGSESGFSVVSAGSQHTCALRNAWVYCWGRNQYGQLGLGRVDALMGVAQPTFVLAGAKAVAAGNNTTCAVMADDTLRCWGDNAAGQTGVFPGAAEPVGPIVFQR